MAGVAADSVSLPSYYSPVGGTPASIMQRAGLGGAGSTFYAQLDGGGCGRRAGNCYSIPTGERLLHQDTLCTHPSYCNSHLAEQIPWRC
jgi:hypothetical protein